MTVTHDDIRELLKAGDMTSGEIARFFGVNVAKVSKCLSHMRTAAYPTVHIVRWNRDGIGKAYLRAVYRLGPGRNAKKPPAMTNKEVLQNRRARRAVTRVQAPASVWELA